MKWFVSGTLFVLLCLGLILTYTSLVDPAQAQAQAKDDSGKITVLSPIGIPPEVHLKPMAPRLDTLDGKTVYLVNDGYLGTDILLGEMQAWFKENMPEVNTVYKVKGGGGFAAEDPALWADIGEKADAVVMGMGH